MKRLLLATMHLLVFLLASQVRADNGGANQRDVYDLPTPVAIQGRTHNIDQSFSLNVGYISSDSFNRGFPVSLNYSFYFRPYFAWEVASFSYNFNSPTQLKQELQGATPPVQNIGFGGVLDYPQTIVMTGLIYTPLYGKSLLFNKSIVHGETSFYLGAGTILFGHGDRVPTVAPGLQGRYFLTPKTALRLYLRQYLFNDARMGFTGLTELGIGYEFQFAVFSRHESSSDEDE